jgi:hypothetical protein
LISESNSRHAREAYGISTPIRRGRPLRCARAASGIAIDALPGPAMNSRHRVSPTFLRTAPAKKPRTECCCHPVTFMTAAMVVPCVCGLNESVLTKNSKQEARRLPLHTEVINLRRREDDTKLSA